VSQKFLRFAQEFFQKAKFVLTTNSSVVGAVVALVDGRSQKSLKERGFLGFFESFFKILFGYREFDFSSEMTKVLCGNILLLNFSNSDVVKQFFNSYPQKYYLVKAIWDMGFVKNSNLKLMIQKTQTKHQ